MENGKRTVQFFGMKPTRTLLRYVERQVEKWIEREQRSAVPPEDPEFHVQIEREESGAYYYCAIEIKIRSDEWRSYESDRSLHDALKNALRDLKPARDFALVGRRSKNQFENHIVA